MRLKGLEGMPLKYIAMLIVAAIIMVAFMNIVNMVMTMSINATQTANGTLMAVLDQSIGNTLNANASP
jgi:hypothetical protein